MNFPVGSSTLISTDSDLNERDGILAFLDGEVLTKDGSDVDPGVDSTSTAITHSGEHFPPSYSRSDLDNTTSSTNIKPINVPPSESSGPTAPRDNNLSTHTQQEEGIGLQEDDMSEACATTRPPLPTIFTSNEKDAQNTLNRIPLRSSSSPLRPSQWAMRGGLQSIPRPSPDRFLSFRSPPYVTREGFELSKLPNHTADGSPLANRNSTTIDPFSRRLQRSTRMNDELRSLQQTYSALSSRAQLDRRGTNLHLRRGPIMMGPRQASIGAIWNVGGASAASDTVTGVSTGRGGLLGSGTNAPLYTSMFLNKSDPDARKEAYERRLALAFDLQTDRVLGHSASPVPNEASTLSSRSGLQQSQSSGHVWKDNAWTKEDDLMRQLGVVVS